MKEIDPTSIKKVVGIHWILEQIGTPADREFIKGLVEANHNIHHACTHSELRRVGVGTSAGVTISLSNDTEILAYRQACGVIALLVC